MRITVPAASNWLGQRERPIGSTSRRKSASRSRRCVAGDEIELGNTRIHVRHTPGHSPFVGAVGRPDLPGHARENAAQLYTSIHEKLLTLPDDLEIYPGHFFGVALDGSGGLRRSLGGRAREAHREEQILAANRGVARVETSS
jgi:glyoxylase-like metal-dependent hydrolase (beta-lactamase superfamily II)